MQILARNGPSLTSLRTVLTEIEARVIGCLLEKERTVPDQYPLTLNALVSACNQSSSREPVMHLGDHEVTAAITSLKAAGLARLVHPSHGRSVTRYRHIADEAWGLEPEESAVVAVLLLRGPQTVSELRSRTERLHSFDTFDEVQAVLDRLAGRDLVRLLDRTPGQQAPRWQQVLADEVERAEPSRTVRAAVLPADQAATMQARIDDLEARVARLEAALTDLL
ncbi:MAG: YceH family protein [Acidimicrobiales bacterium]|nr:YceH family protein [Acidimicrobiales bacterium]MCB9395260.1 YceH family protein [Acidimicrobiaceae bacterium]